MERSNRTPETAAPHSAGAARRGLPAPFPSWADLLVLLGCYFVVMLAVGLILMLGLLVSGQGINDLEPHAQARALALSSLVSMSVFAGICWWYRRWRGAPAVKIGCDPRRINLPLVGWGLLLMVALSLLLDPLFALLPPLRQEVGRGWWAVLALVVVAPLFEEWICRGYLFGSLRERFGMWRSILLSALFFAVMHLQPVAVINAFFMGIVLAWIYARTGSLWSPVTLHAANNLCAYLLLVAGWGERSFRELLGGGWLYAACYGAAAAAALFAAFRLWRPNGSAQPLPTGEGAAAPAETEPAAVTPEDC